MRQRNTRFTGNGMGRGPCGRGLRFGPGAGQGDDQGMGQGAGQGGRGRGPCGGGQARGGQGRGQGGGQGSGRGRGGGQGGGQGRGQGRGSGQGKGQGQNMAQGFGRGGVFQAQTLPELQDTAWQNDDVREAALQPRPTGRFAGRGRAMLRCLRQRRRDGSCLQPGKGRFLNR